MWWWSGTSRLDARLDALVAASREAMVNAAKHAGVAQVSVYAEVDGQAAEVFVRDRGVGFDPERIDDPGRASGAPSAAGWPGTAAPPHPVQSGEGTEVRLRVDWDDRRSAVERRWDRLEGRSSMTEPRQG